MSHAIVAAHAPSARSADRPSVPPPIVADRPFAISRSMLERVCGLAAATGARFAREGIELDPMEWMRTPKALFGGRTPIAACQSRPEFEDAMVLHGLSLALDATPQQIAWFRMAGIRNPEDLDDLDPDGGSLDAIGEVDPHAVTSASLLGRPAVTPELRLYTASITEIGETGRRVSFHAATATSMREYERRLRTRFGWWRAEKAVVREGFDPSDPAAEMLVSDAMSDLLGMVEADTGDDLGRGLDVNLDHRFAN